MHLNHFGQETPTMSAARACVHLAEHEYSEGLCVCVGLRVCGQMFGDGRPPFPLDATSAQPHQTDLLRCREEEGEQPEFEKAGLGDD